MKAKPQPSPHPGCRLLPDGFFCFGARLFDSLSKPHGMKSLFSGSLLGLPFQLIRLPEGENDGLVSTSSAIWGDFKGAGVSPTETPSA